jgi:site-specific DNA-methyltransferase (adenine-specific)
MIDLRLGRWQDVLGDVECDALISDPPYSERTHASQRHGRRDEKCGREYVSARGIGYAHMTSADVHEFVATWHPRTRGWFCAFTSHDLIAAYTDALGAAGRYVFAPLACVQRGMNVRLAGDGPSSWTTWLVVARPASLHRWGTLPGAYVGNPFDPGENTASAGRRTGVVGSKPLWLMKALVRDYSRPGDLVCDPCAGGGTTLLAAAIEGRRAVGAECMPEHYELAQKRLARGYTPSLFAE